MSRVEKRKSMDHQESDCPRPKMARRFEEESDKTNEEEEEEVKVLAILPKPARKAERSEYRRKNEDEARDVDSPTIPLAKIQRDFFYCPRVRQVGKFYMVQMKRCPKLLTYEKVRVFVQACLICSHSCAKIEALLQMTMEDVKGATKRDGVWVVTVGQGKFQVVLDNFTKNLLCEFVRHLRPTVLLYHEKKDPNTLVFQSSNQRQSPEDAELLLYMAVDSLVNQYLIRYMEYPKHAKFASSINSLTSKKTSKSLKKIPNEVPRIVRNPMFVGNSSQEKK